MVEATLDLVLCEFKKPFDFIILPFASAIINENETSLIRIIHRYQDEPPSKYSLTLPTSFQQLNKVDLKNIMTKIKQILSSNNDTEIQDINKKENKFYHSKEIQIQLNNYINSFNPMKPTRFRSIPISLSTKTHSFQQYNTKNKNQIPKISIFLFQLFNHTLPKLDQEDIFNGTLMSLFCQTKKYPFYRQVSIFGGWDYQYFMLHLNGKIEFRKGFNGIRFGFINENTPSLPITLDFIQNCDPRLICTTTNRFIPIKSGFYQLNNFKRFPWLFGYSNMLISNVYNSIPTELLNVTSRSFIEQQNELIVNYFNELKSSEVNNNLINKREQKIELGKIRNKYEELYVNNVRNESLLNCEEDSSDLLQGFIANTDLIPRYQLKREKQNKIIHKPISITKSRKRKFQGEDSAEDSEEDNSSHKEHSIGDINSIRSGKSLNSNKSEGFYTRQDVLSTGYKLNNTKMKNLSFEEKEKMEVFYNSLVNNNNRDDIWLDPSYVESDLYNLQNSRTYDLNNEITAESLLCVSSKKKARLAFLLTQSRNRQIQRKSPLLSILNQKKESYKLPLENISIEGNSKNEIKNGNLKNEDSSISSSTSTLVTKRKRNQNEKTLLTTVITTTGKKWKNKKLISKIINSSDKPLHLLTHSHTGEISKTRISSRKTYKKPLFRKKVRWVSNFIGDDQTETLSGLNNLFHQHPLPRVNRSFVSRATKLVENSDRVKEIPKGLYGVNHLKEENEFLSGDDPGLPSKQLLSFVELLAMKKFRKRVERVGGDTSSYELKNKFDNTALIAIGVIFEELSKNLVKGWYNRVVSNEKSTFLDKTENEQNSKNLKDPGTGLISFSRRALRLECFNQLNGINPENISLKLLQNRLEVLFGKNLQNEEAEIEFFRSIAINNYKENLKLTELKINEEPILIKRPWSSLKCRNKWDRNVRVKTDLNDFPDYINQIKPSNNTSN